MYCVIYTSPPLKCIFGHIPFLSRQWDTVRYSGVQLDTARYVRIQLDSVGYSGIQWICCEKWKDIESIQGYTRYQRYGKILAGYR